ncbi:hypothetical protein R2360_13645 [Mycobacteroides chelonae]|nr:hypothetical protein [Mycobacteroides chelonae]MEC4843342.1 hypothetical protein [Mycobacteroides chelonae]
MAATLTDDQRWLLRIVGGWAMIDCLVGPEGVKHLMDSRSGSTGARIEDAPDYIQGFQCGNGRIVSPWHAQTSIAGPRVSVTTGAINRYAAALPDDLKTELREHQYRRNSNRVRAYQFCRCSATPCGYGYLNKTHPTNDEVRDSANEWHRLMHQEGELLLRALGFDPATAPARQLELFEV